MGKIENIGASPSLKQQVYDGLRMKIIEGELQPGTKLREEELSTQMKISRAPVREALNMLEGDGFVTIIPRKGAVVTEVNEKDVYDIWKVRELLEPEAAMEATPSIPLEKLERMEQMCYEVLDNPDDFNKYMESDLEIHKLFYDYLSNRFLADVLYRLKEHSLRLRWSGEKKVSKEIERQYVIASVQEHLDIVKNIKERNLQGVYDAVVNHIHTSIPRTIGVVK